MVPRRQQTVMPVQPVRFYKFIALSFLFLTVVLLGLIIFMSSKRATITIETGVSPISVNTAITVNESPGQGQIKGNLATEVVEIEKKFLPTGSKEIEGVATGKVTLHNDSGVAQPLIKTTRLLTEDQVLFRIANGVTIPAGGTVEVEAYADQPGEEGNIGPAKFTVPGLNQAKQKQIYAESTEPFTGGIIKVGALSEDDIERAKKELVTDLEELGRKRLLEGNTADLPAVFKIIQNIFQSEAEIGEEVEDFSVTGRATVLAVFYSEDQLLSRAGEELNRRAIDDSEDIIPGQDKPTVTIADYNIEQLEAKLDLVYSGSATLNPNSKALEKTVFFGKNRDEVRRYVLKLDHVRGVDIKFRPAWISTVPHIPEHVSVVIKSVE